MKTRTSLLVLLLVCTCFFFGGFEAVRAEDQLLPPKSFDIARKAFVRVEIYFQKPERPEEMELENEEFDWSSVKYYVKEKRSKDLVGVIWNQDQDILVPELRLDRLTVNRIEVLTWKGERREAKIKSLVVDSPLMVLEIQGEKLKDIEAPGFSPAPSPEKEILRVMALYYAQPRWELQSSQWFAQSALYENPDEPTFQYSPYQYPSSKDNLRLIFNLSGDPVGIDITSTLEQSEDTGLWKGESFAKAKLIPYQDYNKYRKEWEKAYDGVIHEVKIEFRKKSRGDAGSGGFFGRLLSAAEDKAEAEFREMKTYGPVIDDKVLFVPKSLSQARAKLIDTITVTIGEKKQKARFLGAFKPFSGFLVELEEGTFPRVADLKQASSIARVKPFYTLRVQEKLGGKYMRIHFNRWLQKEKGYQNEYHWKPVYTIHEGEFVLDDNGRLAGIWLGQRKAGEEIRKAAEVQSYSFMGRQYTDADWGFARGGKNIFYDASYLAEVFSSPEDYFDPRIQSRSKEEERRRFWLGVEFDAINKDLSKSLDVEKPTMDGKIGILVSTIYDGSPAQKLGVKPGDILLRIKPEGDIESVDLQLSHEEYDFDMDMGDAPPQLQNMGFKMPEKPPWRSRGNYLTRILETIGKGKSFTLTYLSGGEEKEAELKVEQAPVDFDSAPKFKDDDIGLTVKNITYEVRKALDMETSDPGVVIASVEEGNPAAVARLKQYEIISHVAGQAVTSADDFEKAIDTAREKGEDTVQLKVERLGKSRFADLQIKKE